MIKIFVQHLSESKFKESNFTNHRERGIVDLLINKFIGMNFSLSLSLSLSRSAVIKPSRDHGDEFRVHVEYFYNFVDTRDLLWYYHYLSIFFKFLFHDSFNL